MYGIGFLVTQSFALFGRAENLISYFNGTIAAKPYNRYGTHSRWCGNGHYGLLGIKCHVSNYIGLSPFILQRNFWQLL